MDYSYQRIMARQWHSEEGGTGFVCLVFIAAWIALIGYGLFGGWISLG